MAKGCFDVRKRRPGISTTGAAVLIVATLSWVIPARATEKLFAVNELLDLTITTPLHELVRHPTTDAGTTGTIELAGVEAIPVTLSAYGFSRLEECGSPSLKIELDPETTAGTPFEGHRSLHLVRPCHRGSSFETYVLLEYLVYRCYATIAEPALRTRLVRCRFQDGERPSSDAAHLAFFVEDIGEAAARHDLTWLDIETLEFSALDPDQVTVLALFEYMVGNTDWSALMSTAGERCCHNMAVLGGEEDGARATLLPFDFDYSGLVNPPYAAPDEKLPIQRVTQRMYRGFCAHNASLPAAVAHFNEKRPSIEALFTDDGLPDPKARARALKYIRAFYDLINDPRKLESRIVRVCR